MNMKNISTSAASLCIALCAAIFLGGCEIETTLPLPPPSRPASTVVINEVFTLPLDHPVTFSWIEFLNPTDSAANLTRWTLTFETDRLEQIVFLGYDPRVPGSEPTFLGQTVQFDSRDVFDVPFAEGETVEGGIVEVPTDLQPGNLFTIASSEGRLNEYTDVGPGPGPSVRYREFISGPFRAQLDTLSANDSLVVVRVSGFIYLFAFKPTEQLLLKDASGSVVDVVRYGNYQYGGGVDPYPNNVSVGAVPEFEAIARYSEGYFTGNTANDFYITNPIVRPVPHWYNQLSRQ